MADSFPYDVFLSHSSKDKEIVRGIAERLRADGLRVWFDEWVLKPGDNLPKKLDDGLEESRVLVFCMSANAFGSDWSQLEAGTFRFRDPLNKGLRFVPLRLDEAPIKGSLAQFLYINWLSPDREGEYAKLLEACRPGAKPLTAPPLAHDRISIARLPAGGRELFGRDAELQLLDEAWANPNTNIVTFIAWGGVGKTALVNHWLKQRLAPENYRGAQRVYGWSFFSQGTTERAASADLFIDQALRWFGDQDPTAGSPWDKGERLASYIRQSRTLLILDGLEPLQYPPGPQEGCLKDAAIQALLVELAANQSGLCVISTRERIGDLVEFEGGTAVQHELEYLPPRAGAQILRSLRVKGDQEELEDASREFNGHAFSLTLLGSYLEEVLDGDIRRRKEIENLFDETRHGEAAQKMIAAYEKWLGECIELAIMRLLGLFDRPADNESITALCVAPAISGLTEPLQHFKGREWNQALAKLRRLKLLGESSTNEPGTLDAHPLVREYFKQQLKHARPEAWREGNNRLYKHLERAAKEFPDTVKEMSPLYAAVLHGCAATKFQETLDEIYVRRIQRGLEYFSLYKLGAFGADLAALSGFFETPWEQPIAGFTDRDKALVLSIAGFNLRTFGRLQEAVQALTAAWELDLAVEDWKSAAIDVGNLSEIHLTLGDLSQALILAKNSEELADRHGELHQRMNRTATLAYVLHQTGQISAARRLFAEAEEMQKQEDPASPFLFSRRGFLYCDLLLDMEPVQLVKERISRTLEWTKPGNRLLGFALENLSFGRAWLIESQQGGTAGTAPATEFLHRAVDGLRKAGTIHHLPLGLLARAALYRFNRDFERAERDLAETLRIVTRAGMSLYLADYHLESARLQVARGHKEKARQHWTTAKEMIEDMGYHRRDKEVQEIEEQLS